MAVSIWYPPSGLRGYQIDGLREPPSASRADPRSRGWPKVGRGQRGADTFNPRRRLPVRQERLHVVRSHPGQSSLGLAIPLW
jgi:hypothetical protein